MTSEIKKVESNLEATIPDRVIKIIEDESLSKMNQEISKMESHIDKVRAATNSLSLSSDSHKESLNTLEKKVASLPAEVEISAGNTSTYFDFCR